VVSQKQTGIFRLDMLEILMHFYIHLDEMELRVQENLRMEERETEVLLIILTLTSNMVLVLELQRMI
jgi:hypothetical protein